MDITELIGAALLRATRRYPVFRSWAPVFGRRWLYLWAFQRREIARILAKPSRRWLEAKILNRLASGGFHWVVFVGVAAYTWRYIGLFEANRLRFTTVDIDPKNALWGARDHIVGAIQEIEQHIAHGSVDAVILNGVFGWGTDTVDDMEGSVRAARKILKPYGFLVLGWNVGKSEDPYKLSGIGRFFAHTAGLDVPARTIFPDGQIYDVFRAVDVEGEEVSPACVQSERQAV